MAKLTAKCLMLGVAENTGKDGTVYATAQLYFTDDSSMLPVGIDRKKPELVAVLKTLKMIEGQATIAVREYKGSKFLDLVAFEVAKK